MVSHTSQLAKELKLIPDRVQATVALLDDGATMPFIARYRKEVTGSLDEVEVSAIRDRLAQLRELADRRDAILASLRERDLLTSKLERRTIEAKTMTELEDIYLPYRPKRRTRATIAKEKGLEPLASWLWAQSEGDPLAVAASYINDETGVENVEVALEGARDIVAEWVSEATAARTRMRELFLSRGILTSKVAQGKAEEAGKYRDYHEWEERIATVPSHRILAMIRGSNDSMLTLHISPPDGDSLGLLDGLFIKGTNPATKQVETAVRDSYKRLLGPSMETEITNLVKERADETAIQVFADNLRQLLLAAPLGQASIIALDPGFRTGCKLVCLDPQGKLVHRESIFPLLDERRAGQAGEKLIDLCKKFKIQAIAIGNGTGGRETETFVRQLGLGKEIHVLMVNESGASIYSASEVARAEFPDEDLTVRGAVSIGRRLMDPLAELVKLDAKSIGVGQYQHDVDQKALKGRLDDVVVSCVNAVGVQVNTASGELLSYVSGLGPRLAKSIVEYRNEHGPFKSRQVLKKVPRLGPKAFEQAAGFLRIRGGDHPLDASAVHPESYKVVERMAKDLGGDVSDLIGDVAMCELIDPSQYVTKNVGLPTLIDIVDELARPGRDPRQEFEPFRFADNIQTLDDLSPGMKLPGVVTNVTAFGAFVDIGVHQDGLIHVSQLADRFVKNPSEVVKVQQRVSVTVLDVDLGRKRISLSMKSQPEIPG